VFIHAVNKRDLEPSIHTDFSADSTYGDYLGLDRLLSAQLPRANPPHHDELLFIIQHQTTELWMKLMIHELMAVSEHVRADRLSPAFKILARVGRIQEVLFQQWGVLETLTPTEYLEFRSVLGRASGFQSFQYRAIEFLLGNKDPDCLAPHRHRADLHTWLDTLLRQPSIYDEFLRYLHRQGHAVPAGCAERDWSMPYEQSPGLIPVFKRIYEHPDDFWDEYEMCEKLVDLEQRFALWRFRHMKTVQRIIGFKSGTGGSSGVAFLRRALDLSFFPELWNVRTELEPATAGPSQPGKRA
jgi:tryptophan 2,3-dioxygenase